MNIQIITDSGEGVNSSGSRSNSSAVPPSAPSLAQLLRNENNVLDITEGDSENYQADVRDALKKIAKSVPFLLLLMVRFLMAYVAKFVSLLFLNIMQYRINFVFDEQMSLKSSTNRGTVWTLLLTSLSLLLFIYMFSQSIIGFEVVERLSFDSFQPVSYDFISVVMLCFFTDSTLRLMICTAKILVYFMLNPRSSSRDSTMSNSFPNLSCFHWNYSQVYNLFSTRGCIDGIISLLPLRGNIARQRGDNENLNSLNDRDEVRDEEAGPLLNTAGSRRRIPRVSSNDSLNISGRDRSTTSSSSVASDARIFDVAENESEVISYLNMKKIFSAIDSMGSFYRSLLPLPVWMYYFSTGPGSDVLAMFYLFTKGLILIDQAGLVFKAIKSIVINELEFGSYSTEEEISLSGSPNCSICFDAYYRPITLECNHIFCQHCIIEWLDHENTCPVCRAEITRDEASQSIRNLSASLVPVVM